MRSSKPRLQPRPFMGVVTLLWLSVLRCPCGVMDDGEGLREEGQAEEVQEEGATSTEQGKSNTHYN